MNVFDTSVNTSGLRKCQRSAYEAIVQHFAGAAAERNVIVELPTGTGKTGLLAITPFGISKKKVLILTPNLKLARDVAASLDIISEPDSNVYSRFGIIAPGELSKLELYVLRLEGTVNKDDLSEHHIIVANYHQLQDVEKWFLGRQDEIDLIVIDEAHHQNAATYQEVLRFFPSAKVVGLTATPFRSDGKVLDGKRIFKYHFHEAIGDKVIRNIRVTNVSPERLELTFTDSETKQYSLTDILKLKEEAWFNRGIALSQDCCDSIARKAKEKLEELRKDFPGESHQIIASAVSKRHAREFVKPAFEKLGLKVGIVSSDQEDRENNDKTFEKLRQGKLDVIVHIGMLGEGFDHPPLGVAAIFRPYKSLNPYIQFIGRVIRSNGATKHSYVVSHLGLNQLERFDEFKKFDYDDQEFLKELFSADPTADTSFVETPTSSSSTSDGTGAPEIVVREVGGDVLELGAQFVADQRVEDLVKSVEGLSTSQQSAFLKRLGIDPSKVSLTVKPRDARIKPVDRRKASRGLLNEREKSIAVDVLGGLGLKMYDRDFNPMFKNLAWVKKDVSKRVNAALGISKDQRVKVTNEQYQQMETSGVLAGIQSESSEYFAAKLRERTQGAVPVAGKKSHNGKR